MSAYPDAPSLPTDVELPEPYVFEVPRSAALTQKALKAKMTFWPTIYAPRKKGELEPLTRGRVRWAWEAMRTVVKEALAAKEQNEVCKTVVNSPSPLTSTQLPIVAHVPVPYDEETKASTQLLSPLSAHDTRRSTSHPLRHAALNLVRKIADYRAEPSPSTAAATEPVAVPPPGEVSDTVSIDSASRNGAHYLLTSLTLFISHEPCIMCSMALLHSRVKDVYYLKSMEKTGGCGGVACVPKLEGVNHRFGIARWKSGMVGLGEDALDLDEGTDA